MQGSIESQGSIVDQIDAGIPSRSLSPQARLVWYVSQTITWGVALLAAIVLNSQADGLFASLVGALVAVAFFPWVLVVPELRWRHWRWDVHPEAIDIRRGTVVIRRTLIPMLRVQHVETTQGLLERGLDLATVRMFTAAGWHRIPLLPRVEADELRDRIVELARIADAS